MSYTLRFSESEREDIAKAIVVDVLLHDGYHLVGQDTGALLMPPEDAPGSRWYEEGPDYPEQYALATELVPDYMLEELESRARRATAALYAYILSGVAEQVEVEQKGKKQAKVIVRDWQPVPR